MGASTNVGVNVKDGNRHFMPWDRIERRGRVKYRSHESGSLHGCLRSSLVVTSGEYRFLIE